LAPTWEPEELLNEWSLKIRVPEYQSQVQVLKDTSYDNLERQGFDFHPDPLNTWKTTHLPMIFFRPQIHPTVGQSYGFAQLSLHFLGLLLMNLLYCVLKQANSQTT